MSQRMLGAGSRRIKRKRDLTANTSEQRLQIINRLRLTLAARQRRISQTQHRRNPRLIGSKQHIRVFGGNQMNAVTHIQQPFDSIVILAVRAVGKPRSGKRGDQHGIAQTTARLLNIRLIAVRHTAELAQTRLGGTQQFGKRLRAALRQRSKWRQLWIRSAARRPQSAPHPANPSRRADHGL